MAVLSSSHGTQVPHIEAAVADSEEIIDATELPVLPHIS
jgi:hypothetical protein